MMERRTTAATITRSARAAPGGASRLSGYAALFDSETIIAGLFREVIARTAFSEAIRRRDDVRALFNHNPDFVLGRTTSGTLTLTEDARGLKYDVIPPATTWATDLVTSIGRGDISQSSFAFSVDKESWPSMRDGLPLRVVEQVTLYDVSPVVFPAYEDTTVAARDDLARAADAHHRQRLLRAERAAEHDRRVGWLRRSAQSLSLS